MHALFHWLASLRRLLHGPPLSGARLVVPLPPFLAGDGARLELGIQSGRPALRLVRPGPFGADRYDSVSHGSFGHDRISPGHRDPFGLGPFDDDPFDDDPFTDGRLRSGRPPTPCLYDDNDDDGLPF